MPFFERLRYHNFNFHEGIFGNSWESWATAGLLTVLILLFALGLRSVVLARLRRAASPADTGWDGAARMALERTSYLFLLVLAVHFGSQGLELHDKFAKFRDFTFFFFFFYQLGIWLTSGLAFFGQNNFRDTLAKEPARATTISAMILLGDVAVWTVMVLLFLANLNVNISALIAGLGVGGVAVALALQSILGDLFASLAIVLDKPFVIGDAISVGQVSGTVEHIGLKTTRVRSVSGEQVIYSNSDILKNVVRNYKRMERRRVTFTFGVEYETPAAKLDRVRELLREAVLPEKEATFDRCHLATLNASSLDFEVVYWMETSDYNIYINAHHRILVRLLSACRQEGIEFAYPHVVSLPKGGAHARA